MKSLVFTLVALFAVPCLAADVFIQKNVQRRGFFRRNVDVSVTKVKGNGDAALNAALKAQAIRDAQLRAALKAQQLRQRQLNNHHGVNLQFRLPVVSYGVVQQLNADCHAGYAAPIVEKQQLNKGCNLLGH